ncbi:PREDICTED: DUF724 domain-containing protein 4-like [Camelina sativa]|uniref:DUF724 domain-containing protein 4-like n=1 Tax=Camelina sativa TaxID=90675 RepID=A0ABM1RPM6_CAMSA|nr:PREDICTED: DUF724 domain-containing protein 4-like [Camelina sativa]
MTLILYTIKAILIVDVPPPGSGEDIVLPFTKTLDYWKEYELSEFYNRIPQRPHFRPLFYSLGIFREWVALSLTMTFIELTKIVDDIGEDTPRSKLDGYKEASEMLEEHGFDVKAPLSRIKELLSVVKNGLKNIIEEQKGVEKDV